MVGATGTIGSVTLASLLQKNIHAITAISRAASSAKFPDSVKVQKGDYNDESFLISALQGQDVLILQVSFDPEAMASQITLIKAAAKAGVKWVLPTEFGSDPYAPLAKEFPILSQKKEYRDLIESLGMSWIAVANNPWFDWSLKGGLWGIDIAQKKATLYDVDDAKFNTTTLQQTAAGVANLLSLPDETLDQYKNKPVYLKSFRVNQREILDSVLRATAAKENEWEIKNADANQSIDRWMQEAAKGDLRAFQLAFYVAHMQKGRGGDYDAKAIKDMEVLGMEEQNLDEVVEAVVEELGL